ncbi:MAG TPA: hypothetical protein VFD54_04075 [Anaerolineales bacterium]|nr:hypothetical protein [Anaerolineales bacterium]
MTTRTGNIFAAHDSHLTTLPRYDLTQISLPHDLNLVTSVARSMRVNRLSHAGGGGTAEGVNEVLPAL